MRILEWLTVYINLYIGEEFIVQAKYDETDWLQVGISSELKLCTFPLFIQPIFKGS